MLESKLNTMESLLNMCPDSEKENLLSTINISRNGLYQLIQTSANEAPIRSQARWEKFREKNSKYFWGWKNGIAIKIRLNP